MSSFAAQTVGTSPPTSAGEIIAIEKHLIQEYRVKFELFFDTRYEIRPHTEADVLPYLIPFLRALGFHHKRGPRYVNMIGDQFEVLDKACRRVVYWKKGTKLTRIERHTAAACAAAAILYTLGHDETDKYLEIEKRAVFLYKVDIERIRISAKDTFSLIMSRFDQYLTCSPISPIYWSRVNMKRPISAKKPISAERADIVILKQENIVNTDEEAREWLREVLERREEAPHVRRERARNTKTTLIA